MRLSAMDWTLRFLVWVTLISASSPRCHDHNHRNTSQSHSNEDRTLNTSEYINSDKGRTLNNSEYRRLGTNHGTHPDIHRSLDRNIGTNQEMFEDGALYRTSERTLSLDAIAAIQELERLRLQPAENRAPRIENGTSKVINNFAAVHSATRRGLVSDQTKTQDIVVFPGPTSKSTFVPRIPEECLRTGICEDLPDYPEDRVASIIENLGDAREKYKVDEVDTPEIAQRIGPPEEMELCDFALKVVIPKAAPDKDGNWHYILNQKDKPLQGFQVEICREDRSPCIKLVHFYSGYEASCKQKYVLRYMAGLNENGEMVEKPFKLPSCCSCVVRQKD